MSGCGIVRCGDHCYALEFGASGAPSTAKAYALSGKDIARYLLGDEDLGESLRFGEPLGRDHMISTSDQSLEIGPPMDARELSETAQQLMKEEVGELKSGMVSEGEILYTAAGALGIDPGSMMATPVGAEMARRVLRLARELYALEQIRSRLALAGDNPHMLHKAFS